MTFDEFKEITNLFIKISKRQSDAYQLGIDLIEFTDDYQKLFNNLLSIILTKDGIDWFDWFMYEKDFIKGKGGRPDMNAYDLDKETGKHFEIIRNLEELYNYLIENDYIKCKIPQ
jgi:hypothetical protein